MFTTQQCEQLKQNSISLEKASKQIAQLRSDLSYLDIERFSDVGDGIHAISQIEHYVELASQAQQNLSVSKFVPASGAASRMFAELFAYLENHVENKNISSFITNLSKFAFYDDLRSIHKENHKIISFLLHKEGLNYGYLPKALLKFHRYKDYTCTSFEEHLIEAAHYAQSKGVCELHFTISPEHYIFFQDLVQSKIPFWENKLGCKFNITFSEQNNSTQSLSLDENGQVFLDDMGDIFLRPGGHGALIHNLNTLTSDIVFIKNIDNVAHDDYKEDTLLWKKVILGFFYKVQKQIFHYLDALHCSVIKPNIIDEAVDFIEKTLFLRVTNTEKSQRIEEIISILDRPLRICGMVENTGEPGGGPYWVKDTHGQVRCQIVEKNQIDLSNSLQKTIFQQSKYFNPVDLVCGLKNFRGQKFDLTKYVNEDTYIIVDKTYNGRKLKSIELPGLWNGSMHYWNTIFVKVPITTFNPVKTIFDLLRREHQCINT